MKQKPETRKRTDLHALLEEIQRCLESVRVRMNAIRQRDYAISRDEGVLAALERDTIRIEFNRLMELETAYVTIRNTLQELIKEGR